MLARSVGGAKVKMGESGAAVERLRHAAHLGERVVAADPANGFARNELAEVYTYLGAALSEGNVRGRSTEGCQVFKRAVEMWEALQREGRMAADYEAEQRRAVAGLARCSRRSP